MIIGLTGTNAAGKTSVVKYFVARGFKYYSLSDAIRKELTERGQEHSRDNLRRVGNELRRLFGAAILAKRIRRQISSPNVVIDSIRNVSEVKELRKLKHFVLLAIDAPIEIRFERASARGRIENAPTIEKFIELEELEKSIDKTAQNIDQCMKLADYFVYNDGTKEDLIKKIEKIVSELSSK